MHVKTVLGNKGFDAFSVSPDDTVLTVLRMFSKKKIGFAVVGDRDGTVLGTVSERDICQAMSSAEGASRQTAIKEVMAKNIETCALDDNLVKVMAAMTEKKTRHMLVYNEGALRGVISIGDVVKHRLDEVMREEKDLMKYIDGTGYNYAS